MKKNNNKLKNTKKNQKENKKKKKIYQMFWDVETKKIITTINLKINIKYIKLFFSE